MLQYLKWVWLNVFQTVIFLGVQEAFSLDANGLADSIYHKLKAVGADIQYCEAQVYNSASVVIDSTLWL